MREKLSLPMARRIALAAQGFAEQRPAGPIDRRHLNRVLARLGLLQIDSVSAVVRAHYMPLFSRLGPYPMSLLDDAASGKKRRLFEYWAHEASFLPLETWPLMTWRMERARANDKSEIYAGLARWAAEKRSLIEDIYAEVKTRGPIAASEHRGRQGQGRLVGLERREARLRVAVLGRPHHHPFAPRLRAALRPARARHPARYLQRPCPEA